MRKLLLATGLCLAAVPAFAQPVSRGTPVRPAIGFSSNFVVGGAAIAPGYAFQAVCTAAGTVTVTAYDGSQTTWPVVVGYQVWQVAIKQVNSATGTCTYQNWIQN